MDQPCRFTACLYFIGDEQHNANFSLSKNSFIGALVELEEHPHREGKPLRQLTVNSVDRLHMAANKKGYVCDCGMN